MAEARCCNGGGRETAPRNTHPGGAFVQNFAVAEKVKLRPIS